MSNSWVRLWLDMPTDPKWRVIAKRSGRSIAEVLAVFNFMLANAGANANERGELSNWSDEDVAAALDIETASVTAVRDAMQGKILDGDKITGWEKRQPKREDNSSQRAKEWRERKRTQTNAQKRPDTDTDTDKKEREVCVDSKIESTQTPEKKISAKGSRLPADWELEQDWGDWAVSQGMNENEVIFQADKFKDWWTSKAGAGGVKLDWYATWRNWIRSNIERKK